MLGWSVDTACLHERQTEDIRVHTDRCVAFRTCHAAPQLTRSAPHRTAPQRFNDSANVFRQTVSHAQTVNECPLYRLLSDVVCKHFISLTSGNDA